MSRSIKSIDEIVIPEQYELISVKELKDIKALGIYLKHKKSGARLALISNEDENKVFCIGFRTPPENSTKSIRQKILLLRWQRARLIPS